MRNVLLDLNREVGVKGSMVVTHDGVIVACEIAPPLNGDQVGAIASDSIKRIHAALREIGAACFSRFLFNSTYGKMIFTETGDAYLVVVLDKMLNVDVALLAVTSAARRIKNIGNMG